MAHETVPADLAVAIEAYGQAERSMGFIRGSRALTFVDPALGRDAARRALDAAILQHLRGVDEMKAALELQMSGAA